MCGIVANTSLKNTKEELLTGLTNLEYRGYDSAGIGLFSEHSFEIVRARGYVNQLSLKPFKTKRPISGIGHTRWATHGEPNETNAHPQTDMHDTVAVVHNGIIENHKDLKEFLIGEGYKFTSDTDTEVLPNLMHFYLQSTGDFRGAFIETIRSITGSFAIVAVFKAQPETLYSVRKSSPLVIGVGRVGSAVASDTSALPRSCRDVFYPDDNEIIELHKNNYKVFNLEEMPIIKKPKKLNLSAEEFSKQGYPHYMLKEIYESIDAVRNSMAGRIGRGRTNVMLGGLSNKEKELKSIKRLQIVACGTSYYAGLVAEYFIEEQCGIQVEVKLASEYRYQYSTTSRDTAVLAISQSGETADTLEAIKKAKSQGALTIGLVNVVGSSIARETDTGVYTHAGPEIGVASTKSFASQLVCLYMIGMHIVGLRNKDIVNKLQSIPDLIKLVLDIHEEVQKMAKDIVKYKNIVFLGRQYMYPMALEAALKLKEISYIHAEGYAAGEMKHGPLALIDEDFMSIILAPSNEVYDKTISNAEEIRARKGPVCIVTDHKGVKERAKSENIIELPESDKILQPFIMATFVQLLAYYAGVEMGYDVDRPRNLAKSVTVE